MDLRAPQAIPHFHYWFEKEPPNQMPWRTTTQFWNAPWGRRYKQVYYHYPNTLEEPALEYEEDIGSDIWPDNHPELVGKRFYAKPDEPLEVEEDSQHPNDSDLEDQELDNIVPVSIGEPKRARYQ